MKVSKLYFKKLRTETLKAFEGDGAYKIMITTSEKDVFFVAEINGEQITSLAFEEPYILDSGSPEIPLHFSGTIFPSGKGDNSQLTLCYYKLEDL